MSFNFTGNTGNAFSIGSGKQIDGSGASSANQGFTIGLGNQSEELEQNEGTSQSNAELGGSNRQDLFKNTGTAREKVAERRERALVQQKQKRLDFVNHMRTLTEELFDELDEEVDLIQRMETGVIPDQERSEAEMKLVDQKYRANRRRARMSEQNQLMLSEWFTEKPEDFAENWMMVPVPKGKRNLVIAAKGKTLCFAKSGIVVEEFPSMLPGGCHTRQHWNSECCILDTVFNEAANTFYVLDIMCWRSHTLYEAETEFRFYWLKEKLSETPHILHYTKNNKYRFEPLPNYRCDNENLRTFMHTILHLPLDGLLFYHKQTGYTFGPTPLVLWIKPWMVSEALGIEVHRTYSLSAPPSYKGYKAHLEQLEKDKERTQMNKKYGVQPKGKGKKGKQSKWGQQSENMDTDGAPIEVKIGAIPDIGANFVQGGQLTTPSSSMDM